MAKTQTNKKTDQSKENLLESWEQTRQEYLEKIESRLSELIEERKKLTQEFDEEIDNLEETKERITGQRTPARKIIRKSGSERVSRGAALERRRELGQKLFDFLKAKKGERISSVDLMDFADPELNVKVGSVVNENKDERIEREGERGPRVKYFVKSGHSGKGHDRGSGGEKEDE